MVSLAWILWGLITYFMDGWAQDCSISIDSTLVLLQCYSMPLIYWFNIQRCLNYLTFMCTFCNWEWELVFFQRFMLNKCGRCPNLVSFLVMPIVTILSWDHYFRNTCLILPMYIVIIVQVFENKYICISVDYCNCLSYRLIQVFQLVVALWSLINVGPGKAGCMMTPSHYLNQR